MGIRKVIRQDFDSWFEMRMLLWPDCPEQEHRDEMKAIIEGKPIGEELETEIFIYESKNGELIGFIELSLREELDGFSTSPIGYIEGWYVRKDYRLKGIGRELINEAEYWATGKGCKEMASDAEKHNDISIEAHKKLGFREYGSNEGEVLFRKRIYA